MSRRPPASDDTEQGLLGRWSERKIRARKSRQTGTHDPGGAPLPHSGDQGEVYSPEQRGAEESGTEQTKVEQVKTDDDMPDLDTIGEDTDMSDFFSPGVSEQLRNQALRRLWRLPKFNVVDVMDDYNADFRNFAPLGDIVTADMRHRTEMEEQRHRETAVLEDATKSEETEGVAQTEDDDRDEQDDQVAAQIESGRKPEEPEDEKPGTPGTAPQTPSKAKT